MSRSWRWYWPEPKPYRVQPLLYIPSDQTDNQGVYIAYTEIMTMMEFLSDVTRDWTDGYTWKYDDLKLHIGSQKLSEPHFQNMLYEWPRLDPCHPRKVFMLFFNGPQNQPVGTVGPDQWGCDLPTPPGRVQAFWLGKAATNTYGAMLHELGHAFGLRHPLPAERQYDKETGQLKKISFADFVFESTGRVIPQGTPDPRASGPNVMGGGWTHTPPEPYHDLDIPILKSLPWFARR